MAIDKIKPMFPLKRCGIRGAKKQRHKTKGSGTPGRMKGAGCVADWRARGVCRVGRSYKWPDYQLQMKKLGKGKQSGA
jgi:hypothetical protein